MSFELYSKCLDAIPQNPIKQYTLKNTSWVPKKIGNNHFAELPSLSSEWHLKAFIIKLQNAPENKIEIENFYSTFIQDLKKLRDDEKVDETLTNQIYTVIETHFQNNESLQKKIKDAWGEEDLPTTQEIDEKEPPYDEIVSNDDEPESEEDEKKIDHPVGENVNDEERDTNLTLRNI